MIWYTWRQSRIALLVFFVVTLGFAIALIHVDIHIYQNVHALQNPICQQVQVHACEGTFDDLSLQQSNFRIISAILLALPVLLGIFIGVPLVAGEYEQRTYLFIWTQGITRRRWLSIQLAIIFSAVIALTAILGFVVNWGVSAIFTPEVINYSDVAERFSLWGFDLSGTAPMAYAAFALALGLASGAILRRTLPSVAVVLVGYLGVRLPLAFFARMFYIPPVLRTFDVLNQSSWDSITGPYAWIISQGYQLHGQIYPGGIDVPKPSYCASVAGPNAENMDALFQCLHDHGWLSYILYQPYDRFWPLQGIETAIFLALAAGLVVVTFALVLRRPQ